jgi:hypothetical protein
MLKAYLEDLTAMRCWAAHDFDGAGIRGQILASISTARLALTNLTVPAPSDSTTFVVNVNTCIETGISLGAARALGLDPRQST